MIEKYCHIPAIDPINGQQVFVLPVNDIFEKTASIVKEAQVSDEIAQVIDGIVPEAGHRYVLVNGIGSGEFWSCFPAGTEILMADGSQRDIEDVLPGDKVVTHKNRSRKVTNVTRGRHARGLTRVEFSSTVNVLRATHEHPVLVIPRDQWVAKRQRVFTKRKRNDLSYEQAQGKFLKSLKPVWMNISEIRRGDRVMMPLETGTSVSGDLKDNARLFGYYLSEGCSAAARKHYRPTGKRYVYPDRQMVFVTSADEVEIHGEIVKAGHRLGRKTQTRYITSKSDNMANSKNNACRQNLTHSETTQAAVLHMGKGAASKFLSPDAMRMPRKWQLEFLGAYLNGDGCQVNASQDRYDGTICASTASRKLAMGLQKMMWRLGIRASVYKGMQRSPVSYGNTIYEIDVPRFQAGLLRPHTTFPKKVDPGKTTAMVVVDEKFAYVPVRNVAEEEFEGTVYNLEVEEDNSYVAEGVAVHNSNKNGDYFPELGLSKKGDDYGYETFLRGHNFIHHENKDPQKAVGTIKAAHYNPRMHRCELVLDTDMNKLAAADPEIYEKVANGEPVDVSMGSKCDFDVCSICSNRASNRSEYCSHLKTAMNQILDDGRKVYAYTPHPRFFDMSYVTKGADVTAKALHYLDKAASANTRPATGSETRSAPCPDPSLHEAAECEPSFTKPYFSENDRIATTILEVMEPTIASDTLDAMAKVGFHEALSTCSHLGIVLKPEEYQRLTLVALGEKEAADKAEKAGAVFDHTDHSWFDPEIKVIDKQTDPARFSPKVASLVCDHIQSRTVLEPYFSKRLEKAAMVPAKVFGDIAAVESIEKNAASFMTPEIAAALALGYVIYRKGLPKSDIEAVKKAIQDPKMSKKVITILVPLLAAGSVIDHMLGFTPPTETVKKAGIGLEVGLPVAASYLYSAYARRKAERGKRVSGLEHMFIDYPLPLAVGGVAGIQALKRKFGRTLRKSSGIISDVKGRPSEMKKQGDLGGMAYALGSGIYRPRASGAVGYAIDSSIASALGFSFAAVKKLVSGKGQE